MSTSNIHPNPFANQRRSQRILLCVPVRISGKHPNGTAFVEQTKTLIVNAHGALIHLRESVRVGQPLSVKNVTTGEETPCKVIDVNAGADGSPEIGLEFAAPNPRFWRVSFPPADWSTRSPEAKKFGTKPSPGPSPVKVPAPKK